MDTRPALAHGLRGFASDSLRVLVTEVRDGHAWVVTASLIDVGTKLTIREDQIEWIDDAHAGDAVAHRTGLVSLGGAL